LRTLDQWLELQQAVHPKTIDMGLQRVSSVARVLGVDKPRSRVITVGGTNGKGSTVAHLDALFRAGGASTGMFTSPHFIHYNERIRVGGIDVEDAELVDAFERIEAARGTTTLTFFEYNALAALLIFADRKVDVAILEVGLGGRLDAVNLVDADVGIVCSIGFDHRDYLGDTLELIGAEKAGIFRSGRPAVLSTPEMPQSVFSTIQRLGARPVVAERDFSWQVDADGASWSYHGLQMTLANLPPSALDGAIQFRNASAALAAIESLQTLYPDETFVLNEQTVAQGLRQVRLAGRFQVVPGPVEWIFDIAHNEPAAKVFAQHVRERPVSDEGHTYAVVGILADKDGPEIIAALEPLVDHWVVCSLSGPRGSSATDLAERAGLPPDEVTLATSVEEGCEIARAATVPGDRVIVFGSVYTVGPALRWASTRSRILGA
jgi:dihydrofolate synthase/folylpolyglutamate synthase